MSRVDEKIRSDMEIAPHPIFTATDGLRLNNFNPVTVEEVGQLISTHLLICFLLCFLKELVLLVILSPS